MDHRQPGRVAERLRAQRPGGVRGRGAGVDKVPQLANQGDQIGAQREPAAGPEEAPAGPENIVYVAGWA